MKNIYTNFKKAPKKKWVKENRKGERGNIKFPLIPFPLSKWQLQFQ